MYQCSSDEPGHERRVLDGIPEPPAAPAELVVSPKTSQRDAASKKHPRHRGPWPRPACPRCIEPAAYQCGDCKSESYREPDVAHIKHWWMRDHGRVLEQRIQVATVDRNGRQACEGIRSEQHEQQEAEAHDSHYTQHARNHLF